MFIFYPSPGSRPVIFYITSRVLPGPFSGAAAKDMAGTGHEASRFNKGTVLMHDLDDKAGAIAAWRDLLELNPLAMAPSGQSVDELIQHYTKHVHQGSSGSYREFLSGAAMF